MVVVQTPSGVVMTVFIHVTKIKDLMMSKLKLNIAFLSATVFIAGSAYASIDTAPSCSVDNSTATITVTVDNSSTLSSSAVIKLDNTSITGSHTLSNGNRTISAAYGSTCSNLSSVQITVSDGDTTHE